jgi:deoxyhypusine synthase
MLDCTGAIGVCGEWMLKLMEGAVDSSGSRRVHSHVEHFDGTVSPPGFAAVVLLDESHVSAHCYSEQGLLAIDAFTCGNTDPDRIIEIVEKSLSESFPKMTIKRRKRVERFLTENINGGVRGFVDRHFSHFNAGALRDCAKSLDSFLTNGGRLMITIAGAMSTAEIGKSLAPLIRSGKVHAITCTGANLEEDVFNLVAHSSFKRIPNWRDLTKLDDAKLLDEGYNRVTDTCIPENEAIRHIESKILEQWKKGQAFPHEHIMAILDDLEADIPRTDSWLIAARDAKIPVYVPGWEDSTLGNIFAAHCIDGNCESSAVKTGIDYMIHLADWYRNAEHPLGFLQLGGGIAGDFPICVVPMLRQDLEIDAPLWSWFAQISESSASYGGYSGAPPSEKISWGKLAPDVPMHIIESDATIVAPILFSYILD